MKAAGYIRVSTAEQMHGYSMAAQAEILQKYADEHDMELVRIYADEGISASKALHKRKAILQLLDDAEKGKMEVILFKDLSRWSRSPAQFYAVQDRLDKCNVAWIAVEQPNLETLSASGKLIVGIHISVAAHESAQIGERIRFVNASRVQKGLPLTGMLPFGFKIGIVDGEKRVIIDDEKRELVELAFSTFERTQCIYQVSQALKDAGSMQWETSVRKMLHNPLYKGEYHGVKNYCEPYITEQRWNSIQNMLSKRHYTPPTENRAYIFSSLVKCKECGRSMVGKTKTGDLAYYACPNYAAKLCDHKHMIREDALEKYMLDLVSEKLDNHQILIKPKRKKNTAQIKNKLERLKELYIDGDISKEIYTQRKEDFEQQLTEALSVPQKPILIEGWDELYQQATKQAKNAAWKAIIDKIEIDKDSNIEVIFAPIR